MEAFSIEFEIKSPFEWELPNSNKIAGALSWAWRLISGNGELVKLFEEKKIAVSSLFPMYGETYFLPKPCVLNLLSGLFQDDGIDAKDIKKAKFISQGAFNLFIEKLALFEDEIPYFNGFDASDNMKDRVKDLFEKIYVHEESVVFLKDENIPKKEKVVGEDILIRNSIDRRKWTVREGILINEKIIFIRSAYFIVAVDGKEDIFHDIISPCLKLIEIIGFGAGRTIGRGKMKLKRIRKLYFPEILRNYFVNLSLFIPEEREVELSESFYETIFYSGKVYSPSLIIKRGVRYIREGGLMKIDEVKKNDKFFGRCPETTRSKINWSNGQEKILSFGTAFALRGKLDFGEAVWSVSQGELNKNASR